MTSTPLNPDGVECAKEAMRRVLELDSNEARTLAWEAIAPADYPDAVARPMITAYLNTLPDSLRLSDEEWQAFQAIPDQGYSHRAWVDARIAERVTAAQPEVTGEQINFAGWTCNGIHEPGDYSTCEECRDACDDLARFYNHMMQNPRQFKHWTGRPEVNDA